MRAAKAQIWRSIRMPGAMISAIHVHVRHCSHKHNRNLSPRISPTPTTTTHIQVANMRCWSRPKRCAAFLSNIWSTHGSMEHLNSNDSLVYCMYIVHIAYIFYSIHIMCARRPSRKWLSMFCCGREYLFVPNAAKQCGARRDLVGNLISNISRALCVTNR